MPTLPAPRAASVQPPVFTVPPVWVKVPVPLVPTLKVPLGTFNVPPEIV